MRWLSTRLSERLLTRRVRRSRVMKPRQHRDDTGAEAANKRHFLPLSTVGSFFGNWER